MIPKVSIDEFKDVRRFAQATSNPFYIENLHILQSLFEKSLAAHHGHYPLLQLQLELLGSIIDADSARRTYLRDKGRIRQATRGLAAKRAGSERMKKAQSRLRDMEEAEIAAQWVVDRLRSIGDGIAWRFLNYDRAILRLLAEHEPVSTPEYNKGLMSELNELVRLGVEQGQNVLLNGITNFLRVGDITTCNPLTGEIGLIEVKSSTNTSLRARRQGEHLALVQEGLQSGVSQMGGMKIRRIMAQEPLRTYVRSIEQAMLEAEQRLSASRKFGDYLTIAVSALDKIAESVPQENHSQIWNPTLDRLYSVRQSSADILLDPMSSLLPISHFSPNMAPYAIYPINPTLRFGLLGGEFWVLSLLNISGLARWLERRGWKAKVLQQPDQLPDDHGAPSVPMLRMQRGNLAVDVGLDTLTVAAMEFWMPESIEEEVLTLMRTLPARLPEEPGQYGQVNFPNTGKCAWD
jgi:hypothetical protein